MLKYINIKYFFLFLICFWRPLQIFILKFDGADRTIGILIILIILMNIKNLNIPRSFFNLPIIYWGLWIIYAIINTITIEYNYSLPYFSFVIVLTTPLVVLWTITDENFDDKNCLFNIIILGLFIRMLLILLFDTNRYYEEGRLGNEINPNDIAISAVILIMFLYLKFLNNGYRIITLLSLITFPIYMIFASASRNAFGAISILVISLFFIHRRKNKLLNLGIFMLGSILIVNTYIFVSNETYLGKRLSETTKEGTDLVEYDLSGSAFEKFGDRGIFYVLGWKLFKEHPIRGIGLGNFSQYLGEKLVLHSEFMIQLCELGIIGSLLFLLFYGWIGKGLLYCWKSDSGNRKITEAYIVSLMIILFMGLSIFQYSNPIIFCLSGAIIAHIRGTKEKFIEKES